MGQKKYKEWQSKQERQRGDVAADAARLIEANRFDEADGLVQRADSSIMGAVMLAKLYDARLRTLASGALSRGDTTAETVFRRAKEWAQSTYPEPHTAMEAESYSEGRADDEAKLVEILGYRPGERERTN